MLQVSFIDHEIPDSSLSAITPSKIFYYHNNHIFSYEIQSKTHLKLFQIERPSFLISLLKTYLCFVNGNKVKIFNHVNLCANTVEVNLKEIPIKVVQYENSLCFIYKDTVELLFIKKDGTISLNCIEISILDMCCSKEKSFILTREGKVFKTMNLFVMRSLMAMTEMNGISKGESTGIFIEGNHIFISKYKNNTTSEIDTTTKDKSTSEIEKASSNDALNIYSSFIVEKYEISGNCLNLEYSLDKINSIVKIQSGFLLGSDLIQLDKAPFLVVKDKLFSFNGQIGISANRIYLIKETPENVKNELTYEMKSFSKTINENLIEIPDFFKDEKQRKNYLENEVKIKKYEILINQINELEKDLEVREKSILETYENISREIKDLEVKKESIETLVYALRKRAEKVSFKGNSEGFYGKINYLEKVLEKLPGLMRNELSEFKNRLLAQKVALTSKFVQ